MTPIRENKAKWLVLAVAAVGAFEGYRATAYPDVGNVPTICYGETKNVQMGDVKDREQCDEMLSKRLVEFNRGVNSCVKVELPDARRAAFVSLSYNIGTAAFCKSTIVRRINAGDVVGACDAMLMWNRAAGRVWKGLTNRREAERLMCLEGV